MWKLQNNWMIFDYSVWSHLTLLSCFFLGEIKHQDSAGNSGVLKEGWVQWMTAGSGVVHSEMPSDEFLKRGGKSEGFQLWVNLPAKDKMIKARYQDTDTKKIPVVSSPGKICQVWFCLWRICDKQLKIIVIVDCFDWDDVHLLNLETITVFLAQTFHWKEWGLFSCDLLSFPKLDQFLGGMQGFQGFSDSLPLTLVDSHLVGLLPTLHHSFLFLSFQPF